MLLMVVLRCEKDCFTHKLLLAIYHLWLDLQAEQAFFTGFFDRALKERNMVLLLNGYKLNWSYATFYPLFLETSRQLSQNLFHKPRVSWVTWATDSYTSHSCNWSLTATLWPTSTFVKLTKYEFITKANWEAASTSTGDVKVQHQLNRTISGSKRRLPRWMKPPTPYVNVNNNPGQNLFGIGFVASWFQGRPL